MRQAFSKYISTSYELRQLNIPNIVKTWHQIFCAILGLIIFSGPIAILGNLMVLVDYQFLLTIGIGVLIGLAFTIGKVLFYSYVMKEYEIMIPDIKNYYLINGIINILTMVIICLFII